MAKVEKTAQIEPQEVDFFPTIKLWLETGICGKICTVALSRKSKDKLSIKTG